MDGLIVFRERIQGLYSKNSRIIDKVFQFAVAMATFYMINTNVGFMKIAATPVVMLALAVICTFFPLFMTIIAASALILAHMYAVSLAALGVTALVFLIMYIFYFRLTPKMALAVLLTPIAFVLKVPCVIPVAYALLAGPTAIIAIACGAIVYYMMKYVKSASAGMKGEGAAGLMGQVSAYVKKVFQSKEMWIVIAAIVISFLVVYTIRMQSVNHAWKIASVAGAVVNVVVIIVGDMALGVDSSYGPLISGGVAAVVAGLILELFFLSVDYARSERLQYEDDEHYYYVKAIPKLSVATPEKTVKRINERKETEIINTAEVRRKHKAEHRGSHRGGSGIEHRGGQPARRQTARRSPSVNSHDMNEVDKRLLTQSLKHDLDLK